MKPWCKVIYMSALESLIENAVERTADCCATRFPLVLLHGLGFRDDMLLIASWGRIPDELSEAGAKVSHGGLDAWATIEDNAAKLKDNVKQLLRDTGAGKVNLIAHSKGGLEARYMISRLGMGDAVASLTTICTPHRGTSVANATESICSELLIGIDFVSNDDSPDSGKAIRQLSQASMKTFNEQTPDVPGVFYQSLGSVVRHPSDDPFFLISSAIVSREEGENDGVVSVHSCPWGRFLGLIRGQDPSRGISHRDMVDFQRCSVSGIDIPGVYVALAKELKQQGY